MWDGIHKTTYVRKIFRKIFLSFFIFVMVPYPMTGLDILGQFLLLRHPHFKNDRKYNVRHFVNPISGILELTTIVRRTWDVCDYNPWQTD